MLSDSSGFEVNATTVKVLPLTPLHPCLETGSAKKRSTGTKRKRNEVYKPLPYTKRKRHTLYHYYAMDSSCDELIEVYNYSSQVDTLTNTNVLLDQIALTTDCTIDQLEQLTSCIAKLKKENTLNNITDTKLINIVTTMSNIITCGVEPEPRTPTEQSRSQHKTENALQAVIVCLNLFTFPDLPAMVENEDCVKNVFLFITRQINGKLIKKSKSFEKQLKVCLGLLCQFLGFKMTTTANLHGLIGACVYAITTLSNQELVMAMVMLVLAVFRKRHDFRTFIFEEVISTIRRLPDTYKPPIKFQIESNYISMFSLLILTIVQGCVSLPNYKQIDYTEAARLLQDSYENTIKVTGQFMISFLNRCLTSDEEHKVYRSLLELFITDLTTVMYVPEWPAALFIVQLCSKVMADIALGDKDPNLKIVCIKNLKKIGITLKQSQVDLQGRSGEDLQRSLISYLKSKQLSALSRNAMAMYQACWLNNIVHTTDDEEMKAFVLKIQDTQQPAALSNGEAKAVAILLDKERYNFSSTDVYINIILKNNCDASKKVKAVASQCLSDFVREDPQLLSRPIIRKIIQECLKSSSAGSREVTCSLIGTYLLTNIDEFPLYETSLLRLLEDPLISVRKNCVCVLRQIINKHTLGNATEVVSKILKLLLDEEMSIQKLVLDICSDLWFKHKPLDENLNLLVQLVEKTNNTWFVQVLEAILKPKQIPLTVETQTQPPTQTMEVCCELLAKIIDKSKLEKTVPCLNIILMFASTYPKLVAPYLSEITEMYYTTDNVAGQVLMEILSTVIPCLQTHDVIMYLKLYQKVQEENKNDESLEYPMGYLVSLMKLARTIAVVIQDDMQAWIKPGLDLLQNYKTNNDKSVIRALTNVGYLKSVASNETKKIIDSLLDVFLDDTKYALPTIHLLCYVTIEDKSVMNNSKYGEVIGRYLKGVDETLTLAALHWICCFLKNLKESDNNKLKGQDDNITEVASSLVQTNLVQILNCTHSSFLDIRKTACGVLKLVLQNGLVIEPKLIPYVIALTTDPDMYIRTVGVHLLKYIKMRKKWDLTHNVVKGVLLSHALQVKLSPKSLLVRGFGEDLQAKNNKLYVLFQEEPIGRRYLIDCLVNEIQQGTNVRAKLYLTDQLVFFRYKYLDEILYLLRQITQKYSVIHLPETIPSTEPDMKTFVLKNLGVYFLVLAKTYLQTLYCITDHRLDKYDALVGAKDPIAVVQKKDYTPPNMIQEMDNIPMFCGTVYGLLKKIVNLESSQSTVSSVGDKKTPKPRAFNKTPSLSNSKKQNQFNFETPVRNSAIRKNAERTKSTLRDISSFINIGNRLPNTPAGEKDLYNGETPKIKRARVVGNRGTAKIKTPGSGKGTPVTSKTPKQVPRTMVTRSTPKRKRS